MSPQTKDTGLEMAKAAWARGYEGLSQEEIDRRVLGLAALIRGIAKTGSITPDEFGNQAGVGPDRARELFANAKALGIELDAAGNVVGAALTTTPTPYRVSFGGVVRFAWCALDTLFIPGFVNEVAEVTSSCPVSNQAIRLTVAPEGVLEVDPPNTALSVVLPGVGSSSSTTGLASPT